MNSYQCNSTQNVFKISKLCLENPDAEDLECMVPYDYSVLAFRYIEGYFLIIVAIICGIGNLLTLLSVSFAKKKQQHGFDSKFRQVTIFILNLCVVDLLWSLTLAMPLSYELIAMKWPFGEILCRLKVMLAIMISITEVQSISLVAISRYLDLKKSKLWKNWTNNKLSLLTILLTPWLLSSIILFLPWIPSMEVDFTWNCSAGGCGVISDCSSFNCNASISAGALFITGYILFLNIFSVVVSGIFYFLLTSVAKSTSKYLKENVSKCGKSLANIASKIDKRESKMTRTILILIGVHVVCNIPMVLIQVLGNSVQSSSIGRREDGTIILWHVVMIIWILQFSVNFFIYAGSNEQYQMAYTDLKNNLTQKIWNLFKEK